VGDNSTGKTLPRKQFERAPMPVAGLLDGVSTFDEAARTLLASQFFEVWCMCASARKVTAHTHNAQVHAHMRVIVFSVRGLRACHFVRAH